MHVSLWFLPLLPAAWGLRIPVQEPGDVSTQSSWEWSDCSDPDSYFQVNSLQLSPDPPTPGQPHNITLKGHLSTEVTEGAWVDVVVKLGLIKLLSKSFDICDGLRERDSTLQCPIRPGDLEIKDTFDLPKEIPPAIFTVNVQAYTADDEELACANLRVDFLSSRFRAEL